MSKKQYSRYKSARHSESSSSSDDDSSDDDSSDDDEDYEYQSDEGESAQSEGTERFSIPEKKVESEVSLPAPAAPSSSQEVPPSKKSSSSHSKFPERKALQVKDKSSGSRPSSTAQSSRTTLSGREKSRRRSTLRHSLDTGSSHCPIARFFGAVSNMAAGLFGAEESVPPVQRTPSGMPGLDTDANVKRGPSQQSLPEGSKRKSITSKKYGDQERKSITSKKYDDQEAKSKKSEMKLSTEEHPKHLSSRHQPAADEEKAEILVQDNHIVWRDNADKFVLTRETDKYTILELCGHREPEKVVDAHEKHLQKEPEKEVDAHVKHLHVGVGSPPGTIVYQQAARCICIGALRVAGAVRILLNVAEKKTYVQIVSVACEVYITFYANNLTFLKTSLDLGVAWAGTVYTAPDHKSDHPGHRRQNSTDRGTEYKDSNQRRSTISQRSEKNGSQQRHRSSVSLRSEKKDSQQHRDSLFNLISENKDSQTGIENSANLRSENKDSQQHRDSSGNLISGNKDSQTGIESSANLRSENKDSQSGIESSANLRSENKDSQTGIESSANLRSENKDSQTGIESSANLRSENKDSQVDITNSANLISENKDFQTGIESSPNLRSEKKDSQLTIKTSASVIPEKKDSKRSKIGIPSEPSDNKLLKIKRSTDDSVVHENLDNSRKVSSHEDEEDRNYQNNKTSFYSLQDFKIDQERRKRSAARDSSATNQKEHQRNSSTGDAHATKQDSPRKSGASSQLIETALVIFHEHYQAERFRTVLETLNNAVNEKNILIGPCVYTTRDANPSYPCATDITVVDPSTSTETSNDPGKDQSTSDSTCSTSTSESDRSKKPSENEAVGNQRKDPCWSCGNDPCDQSTLNDSSKTKDAHVLGIQMSHLSQCLYALLNHCIIPPGFQCQGYSASQNPYISQVQNPVAQTSCPGQTPVAEQNQKPCPPLVTDKSSPLISNQISGPLCSETLSTHPGKDPCALSDPCAIRKQPAHPHPNNTPRCNPCLPCQSAGQNPHLSSKNKPETFLKRSPNVLPAANSSTSRSANVRFEAGPYLDSAKKLCPRNKSPCMTPSQNLDPCRNRDHYVFSNKTPGAIPKQNPYVPPSQNLGIPSKRSSHVPPRQTSILLSNRNPCAPQTHIPNAVPCQTSNVLSEKDPNFFRSQDLGAALNRDPCIPRQQNGNVFSTQRPEELLLESPRKLAQRYPLTFPDGDPCGRTGANELGGKNPCGFLMQNSFVLPRTSSLRQGPSVNDDPCDPLTQRSRFTSEEIAEKNCYPLWNHTSSLFNDNLSNAETETSYDSHSSSGFTASHTRQAPVGLQQEHSCFSESPSPFQNPNLSILPGQTSILGTLPYQMPYPVQHVPMPNTPYYMEQSSLGASNLQSQIPTQQDRRPSPLGSCYGRMVFCAPAHFVRLNNELTWVGMQIGCVKIFMCPDKSRYYMIVVNKDRALSRCQFITADTVFTASAVTKHSFIYNTVTADSKGNRVLERFLIAFGSKKVAHRFKCVVKSIKQSLACQTGDASPGISKSYSCSGDGNTFAWSCF